MKTETDPVKQEPVTSRSVMEEIQETFGRLEVGTNQFFGIRRFS